MKEAIIDVDEKGKVLSAKPTTPNYNLVKPSQEDFYDVEDHNGNMDIIDTELKSQSQQITDCLKKVEEVKQDIDNIDVTTDMEDVVTRLLNTDRVKPLNVLINEVKAAVINHVTSIKDTIVSHITTKSTEINNNTNSARDNINNYTLARINEVKNNLKGVVTKKASNNWKISYTSSLLTGSFVNDNGGQVIGQVYLKEGDELRVKTDNFNVVISSYSTGTFEVACNIYVKRSENRSPKPPGTIISDRFTGDYYMTLQSFTVKGNITANTNTTITMPASSKDLQPLIASDGMYDVIVGFRGVIGGTFVKAISIPSARIFVGYDQ